MEVKFTKMHGAGNDYIFIDCFENTIENPEQLAIEMSPRHFSVGSDGIVLMLDSENADARMRMFNADGSEGMMCGNAIRCMARYLYDKGIVNKTSMTIETASGIKKIEVSSSCELISVEMGKSVFKPSEIPITSDKEIVQNEPVEIDGITYEITGVSMGNPHAVVYVDDVDSLNLEELGPKFENHPIFPERINTEFIEVIDSETLKMRVWERGSGETYACGTGASAAVAASVLNGKCPAAKPIVVHLIGGDLTIIVSEDWDVTMKGVVRTVYEGVYQTVETENTGC